MRIFNKGNRRKQKDKPLYVSYRCFCRTGRSIKVCDNKEIKKEEKIAAIEKQINNIITAIASGFIQEEFKAKMQELKIQKEELEQQKLD